MPKANKTRYAILGVLNMRPGSGYDIKKFCDQGITHFWHENFGHIYPVLRQMEEDGVVAKTIEQQDGKPSRHVYSITDQGRTELIAWLENPVQPSPARLELLLKLTFAHNIDPEKVIGELEDVKRRHSLRLEELRQTEKALVSNEQARVAAGFPYWLATIRYGIHDSLFRIAWCTETIEGIKDHFGILGKEQCE